jgi:poly(3-hydroxyalkanoate) depolymerase
MRPERAGAGAPAPDRPAEGEDRATALAWHGPEAGSQETNVRVRGVRLHTVIDGEGPPLLLIAGIGGNVAMWQPFVRALDGVQTIRFDLPGSGSSSTSLRLRSMAGLARLVEGLLDELGYERVDVLGVSLGGALAQQIAHQAPDRVRRLVLAATGCGWGSLPGRPLALGVLATPLRYYSKTYFGLTAPVLMGGEKWKDHEWAREHAAARLARPPNLVGYYLQGMAAATWTSLPWLHKLPQRTLVLSGDDDPIVPAVNGAFLARRIPHARYHVVRGGGHLFAIDTPEEIAPLVMEFLQEPSVRPVSADAAGA